MRWLYILTFGSFIGFFTAFPGLILDVFGYASRGREDVLTESVMGGPVQTRISPIRARVSR